MRRMVLALLGSGSLLLSCSNSDSPHDAISASGDAAPEAGGDVRPDKTSVPDATEAAVQGDSASEPDAAPVHMLGAGCETDADCGAGFVCLSQATLDGGSSAYPAGGLCTVACTSDADCASVLAGARCQGIASAQKYCLEPCKYGGSLSGPLNPAKCHGRPEMACAGGEFCFPSCNDDSACNAGTYCQTYVGLCGHAAHSDLEGQIGSFENCDTAFLVSYGDPNVAFCSTTCTGGVAPSCGWDGVSSPRLTYCSASGSGDLGVCVRLCDCDGDCEVPHACVKGSSSHKALTGRSGTCWWADGKATIACDAGVGDASWE